MPTYRLRVEAHFNGTVVMDRDKKSASRTQDSPQLEQPGVGEIRDMGEDRACIDQVEGAILEREMRLACICGELERRAEVLLAEQDILAQQIDAPDFTIFQVVKPPDNPPVRTAEIENAPGRLEGEPGGFGYAPDRTGIVLAHGYKALFREQLVYKPFFGRDGQ